MYYSFIYFSRQLLVEIKKLYSFSHFELAHVLEHCVGSISVRHCYDFHCLINDVLAEYFDCFIYYFLCYHDVWGLLVNKELSFYFRTAPIAR